MSPRKSSTSSANPSHRPRYLAIEVAGDLPRAARWVERELARLLGSAKGSPARRVRVIRWEAPRGLVEVDNPDLLRARTAWNADLIGPNGKPLRLSTRRSYGTLRKGKRWMRGSPAQGPGSHLSAGEL